MARVPGGKAPYGLSFGPKRFQSTTGFDLQKGHFGIRKRPLRDLLTTTFEPLAEDRWTTFILGPFRTKQV